MLNTKKMDKCRHLLPEPGAEVVKECLDEIEKFRKALQWCSGSADFGHGGQAREGWLKICDPLLKVADR